MRVIVLSSGSKGNCTYIETETHRVLVDIGTSSLYVERSLKKYDIDPHTIDSIFVTHAHTDHVSGINVFSKKYHPDIYLTEKIEKEANLVITNQVYIKHPIELDTLKVTPIKTSHDVTDSNGYIFEEGDSSVVYITDTGYINSKYHPILQNKSMYIFESNHDVEKLMNNPHYPHHLKMRILGDKGHLSNKDSAYYLSKFIGSNTKYIVLAHLSEENNEPSIALSSLTTTLDDKHITFNSDNIYIAKQHETVGVFNI